MITYGYSIAIMGCDAFYDETCGDFYWADEHEFVTEYEFDSQEDAISFLRGITEEQVIAWEKESKCNSLEATIICERYDDDQFIDFTMSGAAEWVGNQLNGIWDGWVRIA